MCIGCFGHWHYKESLQKKNHTREKVILSEVGGNLLVQYHVDHAIKIKGVKRGVQEFM